MHIQRFIVAAALLVAVSANARADLIDSGTEMACAAAAVASIAPAWSVEAFAQQVETAAKADSEANEAAGDAAAKEASTPVDPRQLLADFAMRLRDIRYRRGGRVPDTGFDCSGFVHYVFAQVFGVELPGDSISQFTSGSKVARNDMLTGDLVFFHMHGKRVSHVGIYLGDGRFIHSPTTGQRVRVDNLQNHYWTARFAGARRPDALI